MTRPKELYPSHPILAQTWLGLSGTYQGAYALILPSNALPSWAAESNSLTHSTESVYQWDSSEYLTAAWSMTALRRRWSFVIFSFFLSQVCLLATRPLRKLLDALWNSLWHSQAMSRIPYEACDYGRSGASERHLCSWIYAPACKSRPWTKGGSHSNSSIFRKGFFTTVR